jgi:serine/threonine protein kinase
MGVVTAITSFPPTVRCLTGKRTKMAMTKEIYDEAGNITQVGDLTFLDGILGKGSYGIVRLARRTPNRNPTGFSAGGTTSEDAEAPTDGPISGQTALAATEPDDVTNTPVSVDRRHRQHIHRRDSLTKSRSAPVGDNFFKMTDAEQQLHGLASPLQKAAATINLLIKTSSSFLGSDYEEKEQQDDQDLVAVKIFSKSLLKRKRHMERNKETRRVQVKTALDQVEREIALMKKLSHPNLVDFIEALDSPESDMLYMVGDALHLLDAGRVPFRPAMLTFPFLCRTVCR